MKLIKPITCHELTRWKVIFDYEDKGYGLHIVKNKLHKSRISWKYWFGD